MIDQPKKMCTVFRKSENLNSFGLRGYWCVEHAQVVPQGLRVWEFATSEDLKKGPQELPFFDDLSAPAYEIPEVKGWVPMHKVEAFFKKFGKEIKHD